MKIRTSLLLLALTVVMATVCVPVNSQNIEVEPHDVFLKYPKLIDAWRRFNHKGNYRIAHGGDFKFSKDAIMQMIGYDGLWRLKLDDPYIFGDITRLGPSSDLAIIVIDKASPNPQQKFGLIIFNAKPDGSFADGKWATRDPSLSTTTLGWSGNWPAVFKYNVDGRAERLFINWNPNTQTYSIDKEQIGPGRRP